MCLPLAVRDPSIVLAEGTYLGFDWMVTHNGMGFRCGYIRVPPGHPWYEKNADEVDASAHGGLTFSSPDEHCDKEGPDNGWWLGFDCAHSGDGPDPSLPTNVPAHFMRALGRTIRDQAYVEAECHSLCEQAKEAVINAS